MPMNSRTSGLSLPGRVALWLVLTLLPVGGRPAPALGETIKRLHLDAGRVEFSGMDLNGDQILDAVIQDNLGNTLTYFLIDSRHSLKRITPPDLPEDERRFLPDVLAEQDMDGDEVRDLLLYNRESLMRHAGNEAVFLRILGNSIYIGQPGDICRDLNSLSLTPEARRAILEKAREIVLRDRP